MLVIKENIDDFLDKNFTLDFSSKHMTEILQQCESINNLFINDKYIGYNSRFKNLYKTFSYSEIKRVVRENCKYINISLETLESFINTNKLKEFLELTSHSNINIVVKENIKNMDKVASILKADSLLKENGRVLYITEYGEPQILYELKDILFAKKTLDDWANTINSAKVDGKELSPLEKFCYAYMIVKNRKYKESEDKSLRMLSRKFVSVLNSDYCVCVGFAKLLNELCSRIGINSVDKTINVDGWHAINAILINDEKYGIKNSLYYSDPTYDCLSNKNTFISIILKDLDDVFSLYDDSEIKKNLDNNELQLFNADKKLLKSAKENTHEISETIMSKALTAVFNSQGKTTKDLANYLKPTFDRVRNNPQKYEHTWVYQLLKNHGIITNLNFEE